MQVDYIIIGQGVSGTMLSYYFLKAGKKVLVVDDNKPNTASRVASGIINPVTGRRVVETWMIDTLLPFAQQAYDDIGILLNTTLLREVELLSFHTTEQMKNAWNDRAADGSDYIEALHDTATLSRYFDIGLGVHKVVPCLLVDLDTLLKTWRNYLQQQNALLETSFDIDACVIESNSITYKDVQAEKIFFCNGTAGFEHSYFKKLPYSYNKGEAIVVEIEGLPDEHIYKQGLSIVPMSDGKYWVGSSFEWKYEDDQPTEAFKKKVETILDDWLKLPYKIVEHKAAIRPASMERRPFVGLHPQHPSVGILNGMGTKGCSLAPYFAMQLVENVLNNKPIEPEADVQRFKKILTT